MPGLRALSALIEQRLGAATAAPARAILDEATGKARERERE
jgi:hypothetical protein